MPLDPNIIMSGPRGGGVDVNALYQQQMQGMENINQMERQRKADALAMEDRAAAQQRQEAADLTRALAPAVASVFSDPSDEGLNVALSMVPEQYREAMQAQVDQLKGIPDLNRRKDVVRAALVQDEIGQALLAQLEPSANMRLQADTAAQRAALDARRLQMEEQKAAAEAARGPEPSYKEVTLDDGTLVLMDTKSGKIIRPTMEGPIDTAAPPDGTAGQPIKVQTEETKQQAKERAKLDAAFPKAKRGFTSAVNALDQDIADVRKLLADQVGLKAITGTFNALTPDIQRDATRAAALYNKITAGAAFTALNDLKAASPAGGALGNVSNEEGRKLKESVGTFDRKQAKEDFENGLLQYLADLEMARENVLSAFDETYSYRGDVSAEGAAEELKTRRGRIEKETLPARKTNLPPGVTVKRN